MVEDKFNKMNWFNIFITRHMEYYFYIAYDECNFRKRNN